MNLPIRCLMVAWALAATSPGAAAFKIDPTEALDAEFFKQGYRPFLAHLLQPIHERMSVMAYLCANNQKDGEPCPGDRSLPAPQFDGDRALVQGSRWNDDPNNLFPGRAAVTWVFWMGDAERLVKAKGIQRIDPLLYRSHFGDLQFLHAMSGTGDTNARTRDKVLAWSRFAYDVATGRIPPSATLGSLTDYDFARHFDGTRKASWTVRRLFLNLRDYKNGELAGSDSADVPMIALGALLHTIEDSYSRSHATRAGAEDAARSQSGPVRAFLDYTQQKGGCHGAADLEADWLEDGSATAADNPVFHGAWIIRRVIARQPWAEVAGYLSQLFETTDANAVATGGGFDRCPSP